VILLCGIPSEPPLDLVAAALHDIGAPFVVFNQRRFDECDVELEVIGARVGGLLRMGRGAIPLPDIRAAYVRLMDDRALPELDGVPERAAARQRCRALHEKLTQWLEITPARVVNRASAQASNGSKPYQSQVIAAAGMRVPPTLVTNDPQAVMAFRARHGRLVYKSVSGLRSIVRELHDEDLPRLPRVRWCATQFQAYVPGHDVRVHCVGDDVFATAVQSEVTDYRYGHLDGEEARLEAVALPEAVTRRCRRLTRALGLELAGLDLRIAPDGETYCLEVNPSPAFSYYESHTGQPIASAIARHLAAAPDLSRAAW
jgi:glutathione synthase/RimK-type ligase-like ATP-grasp enzyme